MKFFVCFRYALLSPNVNIVVVLKEPFDAHLTIAHKHTWVVEFKWLLFVYVFFSSQSVDDSEFGDFLLVWCRRICIWIIMQSILKRASKSRLGIMVSAFFSSCQNITGFRSLSRSLYTHEMAHNFFRKAFVLLESTILAAYWKSSFAFIYLNPFIRLQYREEIIKWKLSAECWANQLNFDWKKAIIFWRKNIFYRRKYKEK